MSGLFDAAQLPLALMVSADQVPFCFADIERSRQRGSTPAKASLPALYARRGDWQFTASF